MSGPDCPKCGEYFLDCHCQLARLNRIKACFESQLFLLRYADKRESEILIPIFSEIYMRIQHEELPKK